MNDRMDRVNEQVKREISNILQRDVMDSRLQFVSILRVAVSRDLRSARVFYSVLGEQREIDHAQQAFDEKAGMIRRILASRIKFRFVPELMFSYDPSLVESAKIDETLKEIYGEVPRYHEDTSEENSLGDQEPKE